MSAKQSDNVDNTVLVLAGWLSQTFSPKACNLLGLCVFGAVNMTSSTDKCMRQPKSTFYVSVEMLGSGLIVTRDLAVSADMCVATVKKKITQALKVPSCRLFLEQGGPELHDPGALLGSLGVTPKTVFAVGAAFPWRNLVFDDHKGVCAGVAFTNDFRIVTASCDRTAKVWDPTDGREILNLQGHTDEIYSVCMSVDGKFIFTGACVYQRLETGRQLNEFV